MIRAVPRAWACADWVTDCTVSAMRWMAAVTLRLPRACSTVARAMAFTICVLRFAVPLILFSAVSASWPSSTPSSTLRTPCSTASIAFRLSSCTGR